MIAGPSALVDLSVMLAKGLLAVKERGAVGLWTFPHFLSGLVERCHVLLPVGLLAKRHSLMVVEDTEPTSRSFSNWLW